MTKEERKDKWFNLNIRITQELRERIRNAAHDERKTVTKFIIWLFEEYDKKRKKKDS